MKKTISLLLVLCIMISMLSVMTLTVSAAGSWEAVGGELNTYLSYNGIDIADDGTPYIAVNISGTGCLKKYNGTDWADVGSAFDTSLNGTPSIYLYGNVPYIVYRTDSTTGTIRVKKYESGSFTQVGGDIATGVQSANYKIIVSDSGTPFVMLLDGNKKPSVYKYSSESWTQLGGTSINIVNQTQGNNVGFAVYNEQPYAALKDSSTYGIIVKTFDSSNAWVTVGDSDFAGSVFDGGISNTDMAIDSSGNIYVVIQDALGAGYRSAIFKYDGADWAQCGNTLAAKTNVPVITLSGTTPYVFMSGDSTDGSAKATVRVLNGSSWDLVGATFAASISYNSITVAPNGTLYAAYRDEAAGKTYVKRYGAYAPPADSTPPTLSSPSVTSAAVGDTISVTSSEAGTLYLVVKSSYANKAALDAAASANKATAACTAGISTGISTTGLSAGTYQIYAVDEAGNVSTASADITIIAASGTSGNWTDGISGVDSAFGGGDGTEPSPYLIGTPGHLAQLAYNVNAGTNYRDMYFKLTGSLDLSDHFWTPIGTETAHYFDGIFDGNDKTITNVKIGTNGTPYNTVGSLGLFGYLGNRAAIKNLGVTDIEYFVGDIACDLGGLAGMTSGSTGTSSSVIDNCYTTGTISGGSNGQMNAGGLVGNNYGGIIKNSYSSVDVTVSTTDSRAGGLVSFNWSYGITSPSIIENCFATGNVTGGFNAGGLAAMNYTNNSTSSIIRNCYAAGNVTGTTNVGGLVAYNSAAAGGGTVTIENSYWNNTATQTKNGSAQNPKLAVGTGTDGGTSLSGTDMTAAASTANALVDTLNANKGTGNPTWFAWKQEAGVNGGYPTMISTTALISGSLGTAGNGRITGLASGKKYKVTVAGTVKYAKADGTLSDNASDIANLTGTEITGLENGTSYKVEEYTAPDPDKTVVCDSYLRVTTDTGTIQHLLMPTIDTLTGYDSTQRNAGDRISIAVGSDVSSIKLTPSFSAAVASAEIWTPSSSPVNVTGGSEITLQCPNTTNIFYFKLNLGVGVTKDYQIRIEKYTNTDIASVWVLSSDNTSAVTDKPSSGTKTVKFVGMALNSSSEVIPNQSFTWTVERAEAGTTEGVTIDNAGLMTISSSAASGLYKITAAKGIVSGIRYFVIAENGKTAFLGLILNADNPAAIDPSYSKGGIAGVAVKGYGDLTSNSDGIFYINNLTAGSTMNLTLAKEGYKLINPLNAEIIRSIFITANISKYLAFMMTAPATTAIQPAGAGTTADDPFLISNAGNLVWMAENIGSESNFSGKYFKQTADIDMSGVEGFEPIGSDENEFAGTYDGNSFKVSNLALSDNITIPSAYGSTDNYKVYYGLFGCLQGATIKNLTLVDLNIDVTLENQSTRDARNYAIAGGIAADAGDNSSMENCKVIKTGEGKSKINVTGKGNNVYLSGGGVLGAAGVSVINKLENQADINVTINGCDEEYKFGGICGIIEGGTLKNTLNSGNIKISGTLLSDGEIRLGGIASSGQFAKVEDSLNIGTINTQGLTFPADYLPSVGGVLGLSALNTISNNFYLNTTAAYGLGVYITSEGPLGPTNTAGALPKTETELKTPSTFSGWDTNVWKITENSYPGFEHDQGTDADAVAGAKGDLDAGDFTYGIGDTSIAVTQNFTLPATGSNGTTITWTEKADTGNNISISGSTVRVVRPAYGTGDKTVTITATITRNGASDTKDIMVIIKEQAAQNQDNSNETDPTPTPMPDKGTEVIVNGEKKEDAAKTKTEKNMAGQTVVTVTLDEKKLDAVLKDLPEVKNDNTENNGGKAPVISIPVGKAADVVVGELNGQMVKDMEEKAVVLEIKSETAAYTLPAQQIDISAISKSIGEDVKLMDIKVKIEIAKPTEEAAKVVEDSAKNGNFMLAVPPVEFNITCSCNGKTVEVSQFNSYVERTVAIPEGVDPEKITTGIIVEADGTVRHVPTKIIVIDGRYFAQINSLTNSTYSVIWHPLEFKDVENHWAEEAINDMGSRMIVSGIGNDMYGPDMDITRAEFSSFIIRALGLKPGTWKDVFMDVKSTDLYSGYIETAYEYGIIFGYGNGKFKPTGKITREEAMSMISRAMKITGLKVEFKDGEAGKILAAFGDAESSSDYTKSSIAACIKTGIVSDLNSKLIEPKDKMTRAEAAAIIRRLLQKSGLI